MATIITHGLVGYTVAQFAPAHKKSGLLARYAIYSAMLPDLDVIGFKLGIRYGDVLGHRGLSHSLAFAAGWALLLSLILFRGIRFRGWLASFIVLALATASHGALDALTDGGLGVAFFAPWSNTRYFFPWTPVQVSPIGGRFFSHEGIEVLASEAKWLMLPCIAILATRFVFKRVRAVA